MTTEVVMQRELFGMPISQKSKSEFFSATDLVKAGNKWRLSEGKDMFDINIWLRNKSSQEFISTLENKFGVCKINSKGKGQHTWVHPLLFIDIALAISPELKIEVYQWLFDHLIKNRNLSGDSYKEMCGALYLIYNNKRDFPRFISKVAEHIKDRIGVEDWNLANERQLIIRDKIHESICTLTSVLSNASQCVRQGTELVLIKYI